MAVAAVPRQPIGVIRSLTDEFIRSRASTRRTYDHSDSEDVRWVSSVLFLGERGGGRDNGMV